MNRQPQYFHHFPGNQIPPVLDDIAFLVIEGCLGQQMNFVAAHHGFPIQPVGPSKTSSVDFGARFTLAEVQSNALTSSMSGFWQVSSLEMMTAGCRLSLLNGNMKISHCFTLFEVFWRANHGSFGEAVFFLNFRLAVSVGKITRRTHGNRLDFWNCL